MKQKYTIFFWSMLAIVPTVSCSAPTTRHVIKELDLSNQAEVDGACALFEDPQNHQWTGMDPKMMWQCMLNDQNKIFITTTSTTPPTVTGILIAQYHRNALRPKAYSSYINWDEITPEYDTTKFDAINFRSIAVHPSYRRQGVASSLMQRAEKLARCMKISHATLCVNLSNVNAIECYFKQGFKPSETKRGKMHKNLMPTSSAQPAQCISKARVRRIFNGRVLERLRAAIDEVEFGSV